MGPMSPGLACGPPCRRKVVGRALPGGQPYRGGKPRACFGLSNTPFREAMPAGPSRPGGAPAAKLARRLRKRLGAWGEGARFFLRETEKSLRALETLGFFRGSGAPWQGPRREGFAETGEGFAGAGQGF